MTNPFSELMNDKVVLEKSTGKTYLEVPACVQPPDKIFIDDDSLPIEEGDYLIRTLRNGITERYLVIDSGYMEEFAGLQAHYQCKVKKVTKIPERQQPNVVLNYNFHGPNSRVNNNSTDNSLNILTVSEGDLFANLRQAIRDNVSDPTKQQSLLQTVEVMERSKGTSGFMDSYKSFINTAADHITVISPFIPMLSNLL